MKTFAEIHNQWYFDQVVFLYTDNDSVKGNIEYRKTLLYEQFQGGCVYK